MEYKAQPNGKDMANITNFFKYNGYSSLVEIKDIFSAASKGQCILPANYEITPTDEFRFVSSSIIMIDVDDDYSKSNPVEVLSDNPECTGLFYTFSHGVKGNRYRLVYQLDQTITKEQNYLILVDYLMGELRKKGLPVDTIAPKRATGILRTGKKGYLINDYNNKINVHETLEVAKKLYEKKYKERERIREQRLKESMENPVTFDELKAMCEAIGHLPSKTSEEITQKWLQIVYALKLQVDIGIISDQEGYELFEIVSGGESTERYWNSIKPRGDTGIATIIYHAQLSGYIHKNTYNHALVKTKEDVEIESIFVKEYIPVETAVELLNRNKILLVDSPTGSGKTTAFMNAFKTLQENKQHYYIFTAPTVALSEQVAINHNSPCIKGGIKQVDTTIRRSISKDNKIFVTTYNKANETIESIKKVVPEAKIYLVVDEIHKFTEAYNYRFTTIDELKKLIGKVESFIGLTGTPEDIQKNDFDKLIRISNNITSPAINYSVLTYDKIDKHTVKDSSNTMLIEAIKAALKQTKALVFINNKERIKLIARELRKQKIKVAIVTSADKKSATYKNIVENETVEDDIQVVLTTVVLADGVTIKNNVKWSCIVVSDAHSPIFNPSTIKQISNRFRNQYHYFILFMRTPSEKYDEHKRFYMETDYRYKLKIADNYVMYLNDEFENNIQDMFYPSNIEKNHGIYFKSTDDEAVISFNEQFIRYKSMQTKENYYKTYRNALIKEVGRLLGKKVSNITNMNDEALAKDASLEELLETFQEETIETKEEAAELRKGFDDYFDEHSYLSLVYVDDKETVVFLKRNIHPDQFSAAVKNAKISNYETCKKVTGQVKRKADINAFSNNIAALVDIATFNTVKKTTVTKKVYNELIKSEGKLFLSRDFKELTEIKLPKKLRVTNSDVKKALKLFRLSHSRGNGNNYRIAEHLTIDIVAEEFDISTKQVINSIQIYIRNNTKQKQKIMKKAVEKVYGIKEKIAIEY